METGKVPLTANIDAPAETIGSRRLYLGLQGPKDNAPNVRQDGSPFDAVSQEFNPSLAPRTKTAYESTDANA